MVHNYTPAYYSQFQDTLTSICKSILLPFSLKNRRLPADQKLAKRHSDNLKWQQESFHKILNLMGLHKEGIVPETEVSAFRSHLLDTLIASPKEQEPVGVIRDKLLFLQELFYAKCISADEYHSSKRPLLQRLAVQGAELDCKYVIIGSATTTTTAAAPEEEWSVIDLRDRESTPPPEKTKRKTPIKSFIKWRGKDNNKRETPKHNKNAANSETTGPILVPEISEKSNKKKPTNATPVKKQWGFDGFKKWRRTDHTTGEEDEAALPYLIHGERSDGADSSLACALVASPIGEGPDTRRIKDKIHADGSSSDFFIDKVLGENIKKELSRIQSELSATHPNLNLSDDQMDAISNRLPVDKADLKNFFPKSWCDRYGDIVLDVVKKEFKDHVGEMEGLRNNARERNGSGSGKWVAFDEDNEENYHPNYVFLRDHPVMNEGRRMQLQAAASSKVMKVGSRDCYLNNNPFIDDQNPFWAATK